MFKFLGNWVKVEDKLPRNHGDYLIRRCRNIEDAKCHTTEWQKGVLAEWCKTRIYESNATWNGSDWVDGDGKVITEFVSEWYKTRGK